jgi:hypothetical protein
VIVKNVASDDYEVHLKLSSLFTEFLERGKSGLADSVAGVLLKTRDSQTQMEVRGVQETDHAATLLGNFRRWPGSSFILMLFRQ